MKRIIVKSIQMRNFRGEQDRKTELNADITTIAGANGCGKSRHFDAFLWCLFGKDSNDRKDFEVKTRQNGEIIHKVETSVTVDIVIMNNDGNGEDITMKRSIVEKWVKPRGCAEQQYQGDNTECSWNDVPVKVSDFNKRVENSICDAETFKCLSNPMHFINKIKWQSQREYLVALSDGVDEADIVNRCGSDVADMMARKGEKSIDDFKKEINATKRKAKSELDEIQPRIDQTQAMKPVVERSLVDLGGDLAKVNAEIDSLNGDNGHFGESLHNLKARIAELKTRNADIEHAAKQDAHTKQQKANAERENMLTDSQIKKSEVSRHETALGILQRNHENAEMQMQSMEKKRNELRAQWYDANNSQYSGSDICQHCGQKLPETMIADAENKFAENKRKTLDEINKTGQKVNEDIKKLTESIKQNEADIHKSVERIKEQRAQIDAMERKIAEMGIITVEVENYQESPEYKTNNAEIEKITAELREYTQKMETASEKNGERLHELMSQRDDIKKAMSDHDMVKRCDQTIKELEERGRSLSEAIAEIEKTEFALQKFTSAKMSEIESRVNGMFKTVTWKLFDRTLDGNEFECCTPIVNGVPYGAANTAAQINAGLDIINVLSSSRGISVPIFVDNREAVNEIIETESQRIDLVVTNDNKLIIH